VGMKTYKSVPNFIYNSNLNLNYKNKLDIFNVNNTTHIDESLLSLDLNNLFKNNNNLNNSQYDFDKMEEVDESSENLRTKVNNFPIKLIKGIINKQNTTLLQNNENLNKNILFSYRINNDNVVEKISQIEQF